MKLIACSFLLLVILEEAYCQTTSTVNKTSTTWGYDYSLSDTRGFKVKHDDKGYQFDPFYNSTSKKHYNNYSRLVYDHFTSPGATNDSQLHSSTNNVINGTSNDTTNSRSKNAGESDKETNNTLLDKSPVKDATIVSVTKTHTLSVTETRTEAPIATDKTSFGTPSSSHVPSSGQFYKMTFGTPYSSQNTPVDAPSTGPLYYMQVPPYGQMYGPAGGSIYGISSSQMYGPPMGPMYGPPTPTGGTYGPTGPIYGLPTHPIYGYAPQNGQMYGPPNGQMYDLQNGQTNGYPTGSLYGSHRNY